MREAGTVVLLALLLVGCGSAPRDAPPEAIDRAGAPMVTAPRELSSRSADPCRTLLSAAQVRQLDYRLPGTTGVDALGSSTCTWRGEDTARRSTVSVVLSRDLFVDTYRNRFLPIFRPLEIDGLPAVDIMTGPQDQTCTTTVGVADGQSLDLNTSVGGGLDGLRDGDPCEEGHRVAEEIVSTLPPR